MFNLLISEPKANEVLLLTQDSVLRGDGTFWDGTFWVVHQYKILATLQSPYEKVCPRIEHQNVRVNNPRKAYCYQMNI
jgi:hypothetical protein